MHDLQKSKITRKNPAIQKFGTNWMKKGHRLTLARNWSFQLQKSAVGKFLNILLLIQFFQPWFQGVHNLVNCRHYAIIETAAEKIHKHLWWNSCFDKLPVQAKLLLSSNPAKPALTHPGSVSDDNKVFSGISWNLPELDTGDFTGYIVHGPQHFFLVCWREVFVELVLDHPTWPELFRIGKRGFQTCWISQT